MFQGLLPREVGFFDFFEKHAALAVKASEILVKLTCGPLAEHVSMAAQIKELELQADTVTHNCLEALGKTFITPIDRADIHSLVKKMDDVVDSVDAVASRISLYEFAVIREEAQTAAEVLLRAVRDIAAAVSALRNLKNTKLINDKLISILNWENEGDSILRAALTRLFRDESNAILVIKWKEIFERLERATDRCEEIAHIIEKIVIEAT